MLILSFVYYIRFCALVINDITNYLGIACFTVRKKDPGGTWRNPKDLPNGKQA
jgi:ethanolaminephosphotransferase